ncbi:Pre-mRNA splicing factor PRP21 like protein-domain-containing protein [Limtongia smithiae]|uniref:Pre-mRNA splicing factor PRP21 like protein-domain-containing protein n=1 Tax=Limtongia smithiae TaxID=1125753 RepID=UPI0034CD1C66
MSTAVDTNGRDTPHAQIAAPVGIIIPPPDIREIIEKTAGYVHRNGQAFEARIRDNEKNNNRFSFLNPADPYYPFYEWRLDEHREGRSGYGVTAASAKSDANGQSSQQGAKAAGPAAPPPFQFAAPLPPLSTQDLDVIRLTALFTARNGRAFANALAQREERSFQFDFLRPNHSLYPYFTKMIEQYQKVLKPSEEMLGRLKSNVENKYSVLERAKLRADWQKQQAEKSQKEAEAAEAEKIAYAQIDWHDFVVVETIEFTPNDNEISLPPPMTLSQLVHASLEQKQMMSLFNDASRLVIEEAPPDFTQESEQQQLPPAVQLMPLPAVKAPGVPEVPRAAETQEEQRIRERREAMQRQRLASSAAVQNPGMQNIKILPQGASRRSILQNNNSSTLQECPTCHEMIPVAEFNEHRRIELLDPRWKEEKAKNEARAAVSNLAYDEISTNFKRFASARSDLFDAQGNALTPEEAARQKKR